jgi:hypothetical protein
MVTTLRRRALTIPADVGELWASAFAVAGVLALLALNEVLVVWIRRDDTSTDAAAQH